jgi:hypothetical protein
MKRDYASKDDPKGSTKSPHKVAGLDDAPFRGYINVELSAEQKDRLDEWVQTSSYWDTLESSLASGVNISCKREPTKGGFIASATQRDPTSPNAGLVVTARANEGVKALARLLFVLAFLFHKPRWEDTQPLADPDRW